jgi:hypothetical protein
MSATIAPRPVALKIVLLEPCLPSDCDDVRVPAHLLPSGSA